MIQLDWKTFRIPREVS